VKGKLSRTTRILRRVGLFLWIALVLACFVAYLSNPSAFTPARIAAFLERFQGLIWLIYLLLSVLRGFTLLPSTPLVIAGTILFPGQPLAVFAASLTGILVSSTLIYYFSEFLGFDEYFESHSPKTMHKIRARLEHPLGVVFVAGWAFFPFVPTDLVCYLAGTTRMTFWKFILAVGVGEAVLCSLYVFLGGSLLGYAR